MATSLKQAAARAMDLYYQDYAPRDAFFDVPDFKFHFSVIYNEMFDADFQMFRKMNRQETGFGNVEITSQWLVKEPLKIQAEKIEPIFSATPSSCIFGFGYDAFAYSLDSVKPASPCGCKLQKLSRDEVPYIDISTPTSLCYYWLDANNKISFLNDVKEVFVSYIPSVDAANDNCVISDLIVAKVIKATLDIMFKSKNGNVVDDTNDGNPNGTLQNQQNPALNKAQQV